MYLRTGGVKRDYATVIGQATNTTFATASHASTTTDNAVQMMNNLKVMRQRPDDDNRTALEINTESLHNLAALWTQLNQADDLPEVIRITKNPAAPQAGQVFKAPHCDYASAICLLLSLCAASGKMVCVEFIDPDVPDLPQGWSRSYFWRHCCMGCGGGSAAVIRSAQQRTRPFILDTL